MTSPSVLAESSIVAPIEKLEENAKGLRISVQIYTDDGEKAIEEAFNTYLKAKITAIDNKIPLAPVDTKETNNK